MNILGPERVWNISRLQYKEPGTLLLRHKHERKVLVSNRRQRWFLLLDFFPDFCGFLLLLLKGYLSS
jgi:hypothetical protein